MSDLVSSFESGRAKLVEAKHKYNRYKNPKTRRGKYKYQPSPDEINFLMRTCSAGILTMKNTLNFAVLEFAQQQPLFTSEAPLLNIALEFPIFYSQKRFLNWTTRPLSPGSSFYIEDLYGPDVIDFFDSVQPYLEEFKNHNFIYRTGLKDLDALTNKVSQWDSTKVVPFMKSLDVKKLEEYYVIVHDELSESREYLLTPYYQPHYQPLGYSEGSAECITINKQGGLGKIDPFLSPALTGILKRFEEKSFYRMPNSYIRNVII